MELLLKFQTNSEEETFNLGVKIGKLLQPGEIVTLTGDLGAGKTKFTCGAAESLGIHDYITSPTFTIVNEYNGENILMYHFDLYRLSSYEELIDIGFEEYAQKPCVMFIEWPDNIPEIRKIYQNRIMEIKIVRRDDISLTRRDIEIRRYEK